MQALYIQLVPTDRQHVQRRIIQTPVSQVFTSSAVVTDLRAPATQGGGAPALNCPHNCRKCPKFLGSKAVQLLHFIPKFKKNSQESWDSDSFV